MKKVFSVLLLCFVVISAKAQESFQVPALTDADKHARAVFQTDGFILNTINYAKSLGKTVEDVASFTGEQFKFTWNKEEGFSALVNGTLYNWSCFTPNSKIEILQQSGTMVKFKANTISPNLKKDGQQFGVTYDDYLTFTRIVHEKIAEYFGADYSQTTTDDGMIITIKKK